MCCVLETTRCVVLWPGGAGLLRWHIHCPFFVWRLLSRQSIFELRHLFCWFFLLRLSSTTQPSRPLIPAAVATRPLPNSSQNSQARYASRMVFRHGRRFISICRLCTSLSIACTHNMCNRAFFFSHLRRCCNACVIPLQFGLVIIARMGCHAAVTGAWYHCSSEW